MSNTEPKFRRGCLRDVLGYLSARPGQMVSAEELAEKTGWDRTKIMHALSASSTKKNPNTDARTKHIEKLGVGVWRYHEKPIADKNGEPIQPNKNEMVVEILKERPSYLLVEDLEDGKIYRMTLVD